MEIVSLILLHSLKFELDSFEYSSNIPAWKIMILNSRELIASVQFESFIANPKHGRTKLA